MDLIAFTDTELNKRRVAARWQFVRWCAVVAVLLALGAVLDNRFLLLTALATMLLVFLPWDYGNGPFVRQESRPLDGEGCMRLKELSDLYPEVRDFVRSVNAQGRPVVWGDLWVVNTWMHEQRLARQRTACQAINGIGGT